MKPAYEDNLSRLYITEALEGMSLLEPQSIHCAVTSPPFYGLRSYLDKDHPDKDRELGTESSPDEYVEKLVAVFEALRPALRDDGTLFANLGNSYASSGVGGAQKLDELGIRLGTGGGKKHSSQLSGRAPTPAGYKPKDLIPVAWLFGIAMQRAGWYLRRDIIWNKPAAMPESVTDRPTTSHEYILMFSKKPRYYYDAEAVKEKGADSSIARLSQDVEGQIGSSRANGGAKTNGNMKAVGEPGSRNCRSVWTIGTAQYKGSHFAVFPLAIPDRIIRAATSERGVCGACGAPWRRVVERAGTYEERKANGGGGPGNVGVSTTYQNAVHAPGVSHDLTGSSRTVGWEPGCSCRCSEYAMSGPPHPVPATVLDPFVGSGTTLLAARKLGRRSIGFDLDANSARHVGNRLGYQEVLC